MSHKPAVEPACNMKKTKIALPPVKRTYRHRYNAAIDPGEILGGTSKTEPDKGISIQELLDKYQKPQTEPIYAPNMVIPVFPRAMDFAHVQAHKELIEEKTEILNTQMNERYKAAAEEQAKRTAENAARAKAKAKAQADADIDE